MKKLLFAFLLIGLLSSVAYSQKNKVALSVEERYNSISYEREIVRSLNIQSTFRFGTDQSLIVSSYFSPLEIPQRVFEIVRISPVVFGSYGYEYNREFFYEYGAGIRFKYSKNLYFQVVSERDLNPVFSIIFH